MGKTDAYIITDDSGHVIHSNHAWNQLCGFKDESIIGRKLKFLQGPLTDVKGIEDMNLKLSVGLPVRNTLVNYRENGTAFVNEFTILPLYDWLNAASRKRHNKGRSDAANPTPNTFITGPSHFLCRLDKTPDRPDLKPLSISEMENRWLYETEGAAVV